MEYIDNRLAITAEESTLPLNTLKSLVSRRQVERAVRGCRGNKALYFVDSFPKRYRDMIMDTMPATPVHQRCNTFADTIAPDWQAVQFFANYTTADGRHLLAGKQQELCNNAALLNAFIARREECSTRQGSGKKFWTLAVEELASLSVEYPNSLPRNARRLQEKAQLYRQHGYTALVSGKFCNSNAKVVDEQVMTVLIAGRNNWDCETVAQYYNNIMSTTGGKPITADTVAIYKEKHNLETYGGRHGKRAFLSTKSMQVKRTAPKYPCVMWSTDGWDVELLYQDAGKYYNRLTVVVVLDTCCNYPMGYAIGKQESASLIHEAIKNALQHTRQLFGDRYKVDEWQSDHFAKSSLSRAYATAANHVILPQVGNAKAKPVERYFGTINNKYCKLMPNWSGYGVTSRKELQPNVDMRSMSKNQFPDEEGCRRQITDIMERERAEKREQMLAMWAEMPADRKYLLGDVEYLREFGETTGYLNSQNSEGLTPTLLGARRVYESFDMEWRKYDYLKWQVRYDPDDYSRVLAVSEDGTREFMLEEKYVQPMALADRTEEDTLQLNRVRTYNRGLENHVADTLGIAADYTRELLAKQESEQLEGECRKNFETLSKFLITDGKGQHKNRRSAARRGIEDIDCEVVANAAATALQKDCNTFAEVENTRQLW